MGGLLGGGGGGGGAAKGMLPPPAPSSYACVTVFIFAVLVLYVAGFTCIT